MWSKFFRQNLARNLTANLIVQFVNIGFPLLLQFYLIRTLELSVLGTWYLVTAAIALLQLLISFPHIALVKKIASGEGQLSEIVGSAYVIGICCSAILAPLFVYYVYLTLNVDVSLVMFSCLLLITLPLSSEFYFQGKLKNTFVMKRKLIIKTIYISTVFVLVTDSEDFSTFFIISIFAIVVENLVNFINMFKFNRISRPTLFSCKELVKESWLYIPFNASYNTIPHVSLILIQPFVSKETVAIYSIFMRIVNVATTFVTSSVIVLFPYRLTEGVSYKGDARILGIKTAVALSMIASMVVFRDHIFLFFLNSEVSVNFETEYFLLLSFILIHTIYNYCIFSFYLSRSNLLIPILANFLQLGVFYVLIHYFNSIGMNNYYSISILVSSVTNILFLFISFFFNNKLTWSNQTN